MHVSKLVTYLLAGVVCLTTAQVIWSLPANAAESTSKLNDAGCLACHDGSKQLSALPDADGEIRPLRGIQKDKLAKGVHGEMTCVTCHQDINDNKAPHKKISAPKANCVTCHQAIWETVKQQDLTVEKERLGVVVKNIESYQDSFHARPKGKTGVKAFCDDCHESHYFNVPPRGTAKRTEWHLTVPNVCGAKCHTDVLEEFEASVHGVAVTEKRNPKAAVCTDCHTSHDIGKTTTDSTMLLFVENCGGCHKESLETYRDTYHGQVGKLGYTYTAKCYDCHGSHAVLKVDNPKSTVHPDNRLKTCKQCHDGKERAEATPGFVTFSPHAHDQDFARYPQVWIASKFMHWLLVFVFTYFWAHSLLWWYREFKHRKDRKAEQHIRTDELLKGETRQVHRFGLVWRIAHLCFALSVMMLILTGMGLFYSETAWAPVVMKAFGGPVVTGIIHRISAAIMLGIFFVHLIAVAITIYRKRKTFRWFGPDSLVPNWKDAKDAWGMFVWFVGKGPKPVFDRWCYWEKFDYWAVFWGMAIIGGSGMLLAFPHVTASIFPGWVLNVATLVHGEEAFLAAVFLFTVHFFNNHFRPDKMPPPDVVMFTGTQSLEEFRRDHGMQYQRLVESGQLEKYLVDAPSRPMTLGSKILGLVLIAFGLALLIIVGIGFFGGYPPGAAVTPV